MVPEVDGADGEFFDDVTSAPVVSATPSPTTKAPSPAPSSATPFPTISDPDATRPPADCIIFVAPNFVNICETDAPTVPPPSAPVDERTGDEFPPAMSPVAGRAGKKSSSSSGSKKSSSSGSKKSSSSKKSSGTMMPSMSSAPSEPLFAPDTPTDGGDFNGDDTAAPVITPTTSTSAPVATPVASPVASPVARPVASPIAPTPASPVSSPTVDATSEPTFADTENPNSSLEPTFFPTTLGITEAPVIARQTPQPSLVNDDEATFPPAECIIFIPPNFVNICDEGRVTQGPTAAAIATPTPSASPSSIPSSDPTAWLETPAPVDGRFETIRPLEPSDITTGPSPSPSGAPSSIPSSAPTQDQCSVQDNTQFCPVIMDNLPDGVFCANGCYNFCSQRFLGCGTCGPECQAECVGTGVTILGCTPPPTEAPSATPSTSAPSAFPTRFSISELAVREDGYLVCLENDIGGGGFAGAETFTVQLRYDYRVYLAGDSWTATALDEDLASIQEGLSKRVATEILDCETSTARRRRLLEGVTGVSSSPTDVRLNDECGDDATVGTTCHRIAGFMTVESAGGAEETEMICAMKRVLERSSSLADNLDRVDSIAFEPITTDCSAFEGRTGGDGSGNKDEAKKTPTAAASDDDDSTRVGIAVGASVGAMVLLGGLFALSRRQQNDREAGKAADLQTIEQNDTMLSTPEAEDGKTQRFFGESPISKDGETSNLLAVSPSMSSVYTDSASPQSSNDSVQSSDGYSQPWDERNRLGAAPSPFLRTNTATSVSSEVTEEDDEEDIIVSVLREKPQNKRKSPHQYISNLSSKNPPMSPIRETASEDVVLLYTPAKDDKIQVPPLLPPMEDSTPPPSFAERRAMFDSPKAQPVAPTSEAQESSGLKSTVVVEQPQVQPQANGAVQSAASFQPKPLEQPSNVEQDHVEETEEEENLQNSETSLLDSIVEGVKKDAQNFLAL